MSAGRAQWRTPTPVGAIRTHLPARNVGPDPCSGGRGLSAFREVGGDVVGAEPARELGAGLDVDESGGRPSGRLALQGPLPKQPSSHQPISSLGPRRVGPPRCGDAPAWNRGVGLQLAITVPRAVHGDNLSAGPSWEARGGLENALGDGRPRPGRNTRCGGSCATVKGRQVAVIQQTWAVGSSRSGVMVQRTSHWFSIATVE